VWLQSDDEDEDEELPRQRRRAAMRATPQTSTSVARRGEGAVPRVAPGDLSTGLAGGRFGGAGAARVVGIDLLPTPPVWGSAQLQGDFTTDAVRGAVRSVLPRGSADVVLSDMAHGFTGDSATDTAIQASLARSAVDFACGVAGAGGWRPVLRRGGHLVVKIRSVGDPGVQRLIDAVSPLFRRLVVEKPEASRRDSAEAFLVGVSYRGGRMQAPRAAG